MKPFNYYILICLVLYSCERQPTELYIRDKNHIENAFISNIESLRQTLSLQKDGFERNNVYGGLPDSIPLYDGNGFFHFAVVQSNKPFICFARPTPAREWFDIWVESIAYSQDSLKCVALCTLCDRYGIKNVRDLKYQGYAVIGIRKKKSENFKIYIMKYLEYLNMPTREICRTEMKYTYYYKLKGSYGAAPNGPYRHTIDEPEFFETAGDFLYIDSLELYWCQTDLVNGRRVPLEYYSNQDSTLYKYL